MLTPEPSSTTVRRSANEISVATVASPGGRHRALAPRQEPAASSSGRSTSHPCRSAQPQWWCSCLGHLDESNRSSARNAWQPAQAGAGRPRKPRPTGKHRGASERRQRWDETDGASHAASPRRRWRWPPGAEAAVPHVVQPGETLWSIAAANNFTTRTVAAFNGLRRGRPGDRGIDDPDPDRRRGRGGAGRGGDGTPAAAAPAPASGGADTSSSRARPCGRSRPRTASPRARSRPSTGSPRTAY